MISLEDTYLLGHIVKLHGYKGEVLVYFDTDTPQRYKKLDYFFVNLSGQLVPFFIKKITFCSSNRVIISLDGIDNTEKAEALVSKTIHLPLDKLPKLKGKKFYFHEVIDFEVIDEKHGNIGKIAQVYDFSKNPVFQIFKNNIEILIPAADEIIKKIDRKNKIIYIKAPEGLIEIYLSPNVNNLDFDDL